MASWPLDSRKDVQVGSVRNNKVGHEPPGMDVTADLRQWRESGGIDVVADLELPLTRAWLKL